MSKVRQQDKKSGKSENSGKSKNKVKKGHLVPSSEFKKALLSAISQAKVVKAGSRIDQIKVSDPNLVSVKVSRRDIPYWGPRFSKGTQAPVIRLYLTNAYVTASGAGAITTTYQLQAGNLLNFSDLAAVFDEYRVLRGEFEVRKALTEATGATVVVVIDYGDTTALASFAEGLQYDTKKFIKTVQSSANIHNKPVKLPMKFEPLPDQEWTPSGTTNVTFATLKFANLSTITASNSPFWIGGWVDVQFRGAD